MTSITPVEPRFASPSHAPLMRARRRRTVRALLTAALMASACGGDGSTTDPATASPTDNPVDSATAAMVTGVVTFEGTPPPPEAVSMRSDPYCQDQNPGATIQRVAAGPGGGLEHVFVYVKDGLGKLHFPVPSTPVVLDQRACAYEPRVFGIQAGQPLEVLNSDPTLHNVHAAAVINRDFNWGQPNRGARHTHVFSVPEVMLPFKCDVHRWMHAWAGVLDHPFYATTDRDGRFTIEGVPPGAYTIEAWHETLGTLQQTVSLGEGETQEISFRFGTS